MVRSIPLGKAADQVLASPYTGPDRRVMSRGCDRAGVSCPCVFPRVLSLDAIACGGHAYERRVPEPDQEPAGCWERI